MYNPRHFETSDIAGMHALMRQHNFAILVTQHGGAPFAKHLPFLLDEARGPYGTLLAHLARPNPQWHDLAAGGEALVIFQGAHAYISPSWYASAPSVPTPTRRSPGSKTTVAWPTEGKRWWGHIVTRG